MDGAATDVNCASRVESAQLCYGVLMRVYFIDIEHWDNFYNSAEFIGWDSFSLDADDFEINLNQDELGNFAHPSYLNIMLF